MRLIGMLDRAQHEFGHHIVGRAVGLESANPNGYTIGANQGT